MTMAVRLEAGGGGDELAALEDAVRVGVCALAEGLDLSVEQAVDVVVRAVAGEQLGFLEQLDVVGGEVGDLATQPVEVVEHVVGDGEPAGEPLEVIGLPLRIREVRWGLEAAFGDRARGAFEFAEHRVFDGVRGGSHGALAEQVGHRERTLVREHGLGVGLHRIRCERPGGAPHGLGVRVGLEFDRVAGLETVPTFFAYDLTNRSPALLAGASSFWPSESLPVGIDAAASAPILAIICAWSSALPICWSSWSTCRAAA